MKNQRDTMRSLFKALKGNQKATVAAYADAEKRGNVERRSNRHSLSPLKYAKALFQDGIRKGWITKG